MKHIALLMFSALVILTISLREDIVSESNNADAPGANDTHRTKNSRKIYYPPPAVLKHFTFGYNDTMGDTYWIRLLQDFGVCEQKREGSAINPETGARRGRNRIPACSKGWGYHMLDLITEIAPRFSVAAIDGPMILSVVADDIDGATLIYEKSVRNFPDDWNVFYRAGTHFLTELEDSERALPLFQRAYELGAPRWLPLLIARLHSKEGRKDLARLMLLDFIKKAKDNEKYVERAKAKLRDLEQ